MTYNQLRLNHLRETRIKKQAGSKHYVKMCEEEKYLRKIVSMERGRARYQKGSYKHCE